jgi:hypothetical protein
VVFDGVIRPGDLRGGPTTFPLEHGMSKAGPLGTTKSTRAVAENFYRCQSALAQLVITSLSNVRTGSMTAKIGWSRLASVATAIAKASISMQPSPDDRLHQLLAIGHGTAGGGKVQCAPALCVDFQQAGGDQLSARVIDRKQCHFDALQALAKAQQRAFRCRPGVHIQQK